MWSLILVCALGCCGHEIDPNAPSPSEPVLSELRRDLQTGSLIFSRGECLAVKVFSQSAYTHVAGVVVADGEAVVYDSMNGAGVRRTSLEEYLRQQTPSLVHIVHPATTFSLDESERFTRHLESQLGRPYSVKHHLTGQRSNGLHCSEYLTDALMAAEVMSAKNPTRVSPGSLLDGVILSGKYVDGIRIDLTTEPTSVPDTTNVAWYQRMWQSTSQCCSGCTTQMRRWILCR